MRAHVRKQIQDTNMGPFLDPSLVLRGRRLIPAFAEGRTSDLLTETRTAARPAGEVDDWEAFYVSM